MKNAMILSVLFFVTMSIKPKAEAQESSQPSIVQAEIDQSTDLSDEEKLRRLNVNTGDANLISPGGTVHPNTCDKVIDPELVDPQENMQQVCVERPEGFPNELNCWQRIEWGASLAQTMRIRRDHFVHADTAKECLCKQAQFDLATPEDETSIVSVQIFFNGSETAVPGGDLEALFCEAQP